MSEDNGKKLLIGGGVILGVIIVWNQVYASGFQAGLIAAGGDPREWHRYGHGGFPFGLLLLLGIGALIFYKVSNGKRGGPGGWNFGGGRRNFFDDRQRSWPAPQQYNHGQGWHQQPQQSYGQPPFVDPRNAQPGYGQPQPPQPPQAPYQYGAANPQPQSPAPETGTTPAGPEQTPPAV